MSIGRDREQARDRKTTPKILAKLAKSDDILTRQYVASNPSTPKEILLNLGVKAHDRLVIKSITKDWYEYNSAGKYFKAYALVNAIPEFFFSQYNQEHYYGCTKKGLMTVASSSKTKENILELLAEYPNRCIRSCVARNSNVTINIIKKLLIKENQINKDCISFDISSANKNKLLKEVKKLFPEPRYKSKVITTNTIRYTNNDRDLSEQLLSKISSDEPIKDRLLLARHLETSKSLLERLAQDENVIVRHAVANNPNINSKIISILAKDKELKVLQSIAINPCTDFNTIKKLGNDKETLKIIKSNIKKSDKLLQYLIVCKSEVYNKELEYFLQKYPERSSQYLSWVLEGYVKSKFISVRTIALLHPTIEVDILRDRHNSPFWLERYAVAKNISTPLDIVQKLTQDANKIVRAAAKDRFNNGTAISK